MDFVFLVHGTWGRDENAWYHPSSVPSSFTARLKAAIGDRGFDLNELTLVPFEWKGGNTHSDRIEGATALASKLNKLRIQYTDARFHFVAHSHGGNVVLKALEMYLNDLPWTKVPKGCDLQGLYDGAQSLLNDCRSGKYQFRSPTEEIETKLQRLATLVEEKDMVESYDFMYRSRRQLMGEILTHIYSKPEKHCIESVVTLGTPFYEKSWKRAKLAKITDKILHGIIISPLMFFIVYFYIVLLGGLVAITPWVSWIGFYPLNWDLLPSFIWSVGGLIMTITYVNDNKFETPIDTNVYFDEAVIPYLLHIVQPDNLFRVLSIHASYLDEAYCILSAYPSLSSAITKRFSQTTRPKIWQYRDPSGDVGFWKHSAPAVMRKQIKRASRLTIAVAMAFSYPARLVIHQLSTRYINYLIETDLRVLGYGLPPDEAHRSSDITVEKTLRKPYFETHDLDVSRILANQRVNEPEAVDRFDFLWNDENLTKHLEDSIFIKTLGDPQNSEHHMQLLAMEERAKEFFGVVGLKHSMYYDNDTVINGIADFIAERSPNV